MSATKELRRMLDERGIEYTASDNERYAYTLWGDASFSEPLGANPNTLGAQCELMIAPVTPAQAIAVTFSDAASTYAALRQESDARMNLQRDYNNQIKRIQNQRKQLKEMQAALERGKCRNIAPTYLDFLCSECGFTHYRSEENDDGNGNDWEFCPRCGRRVV